MAFRYEREGEALGVLLVGVASLLVWALSSCSPPGGVPGSGYAPSAPLDGSGELNSAAPRAQSEAKPAEERPGLATGFGKQLRDEWHRKSFVRDSPKPKGTDVIYYNDREGVNAMTGYRYKTEALQTAAGEMEEWGIKGSFGYLPAYKSGRKRFVVGSAGSDYSLVVKNRCRSHVEVVLSVDGLDVIDGRSASFSKRGYIIAPGDTLEVKGWRTGWDSVARFEFSDVGGSYANQRHGNARNVGVVGLAVFGEEGVDPWKWMPRELDTRHTATPFAQAP
ncbi:hypothetical protein ACFQY0_05630 [Haloferula chungangensis]|uniref:DUF1349 domain-containing protein n=1 Tax=Haloferula chungangensis TaxID=1048331 RepID=A0ABW2L2T5_9BACT